MYYIRLPPPTLFSFTRVPLLIERETSSHDSLVVHGTPIHPNDRPRKQRLAPLHPLDIPDQPKLAASLKEAVVFVQHTVLGRLVVRVHSREEVVEVLGEEELAGVRRGVAG